MDPTLHTILSRGLREDGSPIDPISLDERRNAVASTPGFSITDQLKQQDPFTGEFDLWDMPGSGHWKCTTLLEPVWSRDDLVWFRYADGAVVLIQFSNLDDPDLLAIAAELNARLEHYRIGS